MPSASFLPSVSSPSTPSYDNRGADDFTVPSGTWTINEIDVTGRYVTKSGPANSENVMFYEDANGSPGTLVTRIRSVGTEDGTGSFTIPLGDSGVTLAAGTYWVSVQIRINFDHHGSWYWATTSPHGSQATWRNPKKGWSRKCHAYTPVDTCFRNTPVSDFMFALQGTSTG